LGTHLEVFEVKARALVSRSTRWETSARDMVEALAAATSRGEHTTRVPLFGDAREQMMRPLKVQISGQTTTLPARYRWTVSGAPREELKSIEKPKSAQPAPSPRPGAAVPRPGAAIRKRTPEPIVVAAAVAAAKEERAAAEAVAAPPESSTASVDKPAALLEEAEGQAKVAEAPTAIVEAAPAASSQPQPEEAEAPPAAREEGSAAPEKVEKAPAEAEEKPPAEEAEEPKAASPARAKLPLAKSPVGRVIFVLLLLAAAAAYFQWHDAMGCSVGGAP
jgi:hypothetical protein